MQRRTILQAALALPWLPATGLQAAAQAAQGPVRPELAFVDEGFPQAPELARRLQGLHGWTPVGADVTNLWRRALAQLPRGGTVHFAGVTTASFPFCLEVLARDRARTRLTQRRCGRDLVAWHLEVTSHG